MSETFYYWDNTFGAFSSISTGTVLEENLIGGIDVGCWYYQEGEDWYECTNGDHPIH